MSPRGDARAPTTPVTPAIHGAEPRGLENLPFSRQLDGELSGNAPPWYYVLREAQVRGNSERLGPVGGRIVAEVLIGLLAGDPLSYLNVAPNWRPQTPFTSADGADFVMPDVVRFAKADVEPQPQPAPPPEGWKG